MHYRYQPYPYYRRYYSLDPYYYRRYYSPYPYYNYQRNIIDSQFSDVNQRIVNYGDMDDVIQNANVFQSMAGICTSPSEPPQESVSETPESSAVPFPL